MPDASRTDNRIEDDVKHKKRHAGGKGKGDLQRVKVLAARFGEGFSRSAGSGNRWGRVSHSPRHAQEVFAGDLIVPKRFRWVIESKGPAAPGST